MTDNVSVPIPQGHEFYLTVDSAYARSGTRDILYIDYVSTPRREAIIFVPHAAADPSSCAGGSHARLRARWNRVL
jgi:hypothetical protein